MNWNSLYLKYNRINGLVVVLTGKAWTRTANGAIKRLVLHVRLGCGLQSITASLLADEFEVRSVLHGQVNLAAVNQICLNHEAMNSCEILKIH